MPEREPTEEHMKGKLLHENILKDDKLTYASLTPELSSGHTLKNNIKEKRFNRTRYKFLGENQLKNILHDTKNYVVRYPDAFELRCVLTIRINDIETELNRRKNDVGSTENQCKKSKP